MISSVSHNGDNSNLVQVFTYYVKRKVSNAVESTSARCLIFFWDENVLMRIKKTWATHLKVGKRRTRKNFLLASNFRSLCKIVCAFLLIFTCLICWATLSFQKFGSWTLPMIPLYQPLACIIIQGTKKKKKRAHLTWHDIRRHLSLL